MIRNLYNKYEEIINYLVIGGATTVVSLLTYYVLTFTILDASNTLYLQIANVISWVISVTFAYFTNRKYVFKLKENINIKEVVKFYLSRLTTLFIDMILMQIFVIRLKLNDKIIKLVVQFIVIVLNYVLSKFLVFKSKVRKSE